MRSRRAIDHRKTRIPMLSLCLTPCTIMSCAHSARPKRRAGGAPAARRRHIRGAQTHENGALAARSGNPAARRRVPRPCQTNPMEIDANDGGTMTYAKTAFSKRTGFKPDWARSRPAIAQCLMPSHAFLRFGLVR